MRTLSPTDSPNNQLVFGEKDKYVIEQITLQSKIFNIKTVGTMVVIFESSVEMNDDILKKQQKFKIYQIFGFQNKN